MRGVLFGSRRTDRVRFGTFCCSTHFEKSEMTCSVSGSSNFPPLKAGDRFGILIYSTRVGRIDASNEASIDSKAFDAFSTIIRSLWDVRAGRS